jgi:hypothetical protein
MQRVPGSSLVFIGGPTDPDPVNPVQKDDNLRYKIGVADAGKYRDNAEATPFYRPTDGLVTIGTR